MESIQNAGKFVSDKVSEATNTASKETNKSVAKDSNVDASTRATAAKDAIGDKMSESKDGASAESNKQALKH